MSGNDFKFFECLAQCPDIFTTQTLKCLSETDAEEAKKTINEILTFEPLIVTIEEAGILLGADGGHVHILDIERQSDTVIEVEKRGYGPPPRCRIYGRQKAKAKAMDLIKEVLLLNQSKVDSCNSVE